MNGEAASRYHTLSRLGAGGMSEVFLAEDTRLHRRVALKLLKCEGDTEAARLRLLREARLASQLNHPNIGVVYECGEIDQDGGRRSFIAMEYVPGRTLKDWVSERGSGLDDILGLAGQVASALAEAHSHGVIHRDVKPSNVLVTESGLVKVLDFGLATYVPPPGSSDETWSVFQSAPGGAPALLGTLAYVSPEQALGREVDGRTDVFGLGVVLYELLAGRLPFTGRNAVETLDGVLHADPVALEALRPDLPPVLVRLVSAMLGKEREARPATMDQVVRELEAIRKSLASGTAASPPDDRGGRAVAVMAFENITKSAEDDWLGTGIAETATADLKALASVAVISRERVHEALRKLTAAGAPETALPTELGRELGARWVVSGGYQRLGDAVRVTARLTEVPTGAVLMTAKLDGTMAGIFELQDRIVHELAAGLDLALPEGRSADETEVLAAYEALARGVVNLRAETPESLDRAIVFFERAVTLDPGWARAWLELGAAYDVKATYLALPELLTRAIGAFGKAIERNPSSARAHRELGGALVDAGRTEEGMQAIRRALELDPSDAAAHSSLGRAFFVGLGRFGEAADEYERALVLNPNAGWSALQLAHAAALLRDFPRATRAARRAVELQEGSFSGREGVLIVGAYTRLGQIVALQGRHTDALAEFDRELDFQSRVGHALKERAFIELQVRIGSSRRARGDEASGGKALNGALAAWEERLRVGADDPFTRYYVAWAQLLLGKREEALASLEAAAARRPAYTMARALIEPDLAPLLAEPRFRALAARAGVPLATAGW